MTVTKVGKASQGTRRLTSFTMTFWLSDSFVIVRQKRRQQDPEMIWDLWRLMVFSFLFAVQPFLQTRLNHRCCWTETMYASWCKPWRGRGTFHLFIASQGMAPGQYSTDAKQHTSLGWLGVLVLLLKLQFGISSKVGRSLEEVLQAWLMNWIWFDLHQTIGSRSIHPRFVHEKSRLSPIVTGATVVGLKYKDGVILAADTLALGDSMHFANMLRLAAWGWGGFRCKMGRCPQPQRYSRSAKIWWKISCMTCFQRFSHFMTWFAVSQ